MKNKQIIYLKEVSCYDDILKKKHNKLPLFFKKIIYLYKNTFNIITKKKFEENEIWILPIKEEYDINKTKKILNKFLINSENIYLIANNLEKNEIYKIMDEQKQKYITEEKIKKILLMNILEYISILQSQDINNMELTILVNSTSKINMYMLEGLAKLVKSLKLVSLNIDKFKNLDEKLYKEYGIAIQFSNSYKKSLEKSKLIINFDFSEIEVNEYEIFEKAIIINCIKDDIKIKSRLFNGIIINSCDIEFKKEIITKFKQMELYNNYKRLLLYASIIEKEEEFFKINEKIKLDKVAIINLIGNRGIINKKEFKNISKKLDKNKKTE